MRRTRFRSTRPDSKPPRRGFSTSAGSRASIGSSRTRLRGLQRKCAGSFRRSRPVASALTSLTASLRTPGSFTRTSLGNWAERGPKRRSASTRQSQSNLRRSSSTLLVSAQPSHPLNRGQPEPTASSSRCPGARAPCAHRPAFAHAWARQVPRISRARGDGRDRVDPVLGRILRARARNEAERAREDAGRRSARPARVHREDTAGGVAPAFQGEGFARPARVSLIETGKLVGSLVSPRTAREFEHDGERRQRRGDARVARDERRHAGVGRCAGRARHRPRRRQPPLPQLLGPARVPDHRA